MSDVLASLAVRLGAETAEFDRKMAAAKKELLGFTKVGAGLESVGKGLSLGITAPVVAFGALSLKAGGDFQAGMNRVEAATGAAGGELDRLKAKAQGIALDPKLKFSATDAAGALENLAKNGLSTAQILGGAADASVDLATATGGKLAVAADITTDVMNNFGKSAKDAAALVSNITGTTIASKLSIDEYRLALGQAGGVAGPLGVQFEEFNTALAVTSSGFSSGSDAGTSFKTFLQRLVPQSKEAAAAMKQLGLNFFDAQGKMKPLRVIAGDLQKAFKGLSDEQRNGLGTKIFGADAIRTALLLAKDGAEGFDKMALSISKVNAAAQGATLSKGFAGSLEAAKSAVEGLEIAIADSGLLDFGTELLQQGAAVASGLAQLSPATLGFGTAVAGAAAAVGPLSYGLGVLLQQAPTAKLGFNALGGALSSIVSPAGLAVLGVGALAAGLYYLATANERAVESFQQEKKATDALASSVLPLTDRYDELKAKTTLTATEQEELRGIVERIAQQVPSATVAIDAYGKATDISAQKTRAFVAAAREQEKQLAIAALPAAEAQLRDFGGRLDQLRKKQEEFNKTGGISVLQTDSRGLFQTTEVYKAGSEQVREFQLNLANLNVEFLKQEALVNQLRASAGKFGAVLPGFEKYGALARQASADIAALAKAAADAGSGGRALAPLTEAQAKALQKLNAELTRIKNEVAAGINFDPMADQIKALSSGIPDLLAVGFGPNGKVVQAFVAQLNGLEKQYDTFKARIAEKQAGAALFGNALDPASRLGEVPTTLKKLPGYDTTALAASLEQARLHYEGLSEAEKKAFADTLLFNQSMETAFDNLGASVGPALADLAGSVAESFTAIALSGGSLGDGLQAVFGTVLQALGGFMGSFGKELIAIGIGKLSLDSLFASGPAGGPAAIAAGLGLVALAGVASAIGKSQSASLSQITGGGAATKGFTPGSTSPARVPEQRIKIELAPVTFRQAGPDLAAVVSVNQYRRLRTS